MAWASALAAPVAAQNVQFPTPVPGSPPPATTSPYATPGYPAPGYPAPGYGAPSYAPPAAAPPASAPPVGAPAPYAVPAAPPSAAPTYGAPTYGAPTYGAPPSGAPGYAVPSYGAPAAGAPGYAPPATPLPPPAFDPYSSSTYGAPAPSLFGTPTYGAPTYGAAPYGTAPYGTAPYGTAPYGTAPYGAPPTTNPSLFAAPPPGAYSYPPQPGSVGPYGAPVGWQSGSYQWQNPDGSAVRVQRLLQQFSFEHTFLYGKHEPGELEINRTELAATFGFPCINPDTPLLVTPGFAANWLKGPISDGTPESADLPPRLYDAYLDFSWHPKLGNWLSADLGFRTGVWTDFESVTSESIRYLGRGLGVIALSPRFDLLAGVWYLDRNEIKLLPAGGVYWRPNVDWDLYLVFPNPKLRRRVSSTGTSQWWIYGAAEYGGGRWTLTRADGRPDDIDINDYRAMFGVEWETQTQAHGHIEAGYVWNREILYARTSSPPVYSLDDTWMVRAGIDF